MIPFLREHSGYVGGIHELCHSRFLVHAVRVAIEGQVGTDGRTEAVVDVVDAIINGFYHPQDFLTNFANTLNNGGDGRVTKVHSPFNGQIAGSIKLFPDG